MNYEFKVNGSTKLVISPKTPLEEQLFNDLFSGEVEVITGSSLHNKGEIVIKRKEARDVKS
jgi:hypothetical protein